MLGLAAGGGAFSFKNGSTWFGLPHMGYPLIFPYNTHGKRWEESEVRMRKSSTKQMLNSEMGPSLLFLCSYFIPGHSEQQGLPFLHESTAESTRQAVTIFVFHSSNRLPHLYYTFILYYLGCGSNVRYHDGVLHFSEARLHVRLILIQQELSYIGHSRVSLGHDVALSCVDMCLKLEKPSSVTSKTSRPTRNIGFCFKCSTRATSSITGPLLQLTRIASYRYWVGFINIKPRNSCICPLMNFTITKAHSLKVTFFIVASLSLLIKW